MRRLLPWLALAFFATVPLWLKDQYYLNTLIVSGIFILAAMSLNLLLGYAGQLSLGHVAFFGIGAYVSALTAVGFTVTIFGFEITHDPWPAVVGVAVRHYRGRALRLSHRQARFPGAKRVLRHRHHQFCRSCSARRAQLGRADERPLALSNIPPLTLGFGWMGSITLWSKVGNYYVVLIFVTLAYVILNRLVNSPYRPRDDRAARERDARAVGRRQRNEIPGSRGCRLRARWQARPAASTPITS